MKAEKIITEYALKNGADDVGICSAEPFEDMREIFIKNSEALKGFAESDIEKRINPSMSLENAKSIIAIAKSYNMTFPQEQLGRTIILFLKEFCSLWQMNLKKSLILITKYLWIREH